MSFRPQNIIHSSEHNPMSMTSSIVHLASNCGSSAAAFESSAKVTESTPKAPKLAKSGTIAKQMIENEKHNMFAEAMKWQVKSITRQKCMINVTVNSK